MPIASFLFLGTPKEKGRAGRSNGMIFITRTNRNSIPLVNSTIVLQIGHLIYECLVFAIVRIKLPSFLALLRDWNGTSLTQ